MYILKPCQAPRISSMPRMATMSRSWSRILKHLFRYASWGKLRNAEYVDRHTPDYNGSIFGPTRHSLGGGVASTRFTKPAHRGI